MTTKTQPDIFYQRSREAQLVREDAAFSNLLAGVPNFYDPKNDYTVWGSFLRAIAKELARLDYDYAYDLVGMDPQYLTPPDIRRRYAAPLFVNKSYPNAAQTDVAYKAMLVALIKAYQQGTTVQAISDVITAYTGQVITVQELYKLIGQGYDASYRNTIQVAVNVSGSDLSAAITSAANIQTISQNLYSAIDLAKPAHVGLSYIIVFGADEDMTTYIGAQILDPTQYMTLGLSNQTQVEAAALAIAQLASGAITYAQLIAESPLTDVAQFTALGQFTANTLTAPQLLAALNPINATQAQYSPQYNLTVPGDFPPILTQTQYTFSSVQNNYAPVFRITQALPIVITPAEYVALVPNPSSQDQIAALTMFTAGSITSLQLITALFATNQFQEIYYPQYEAPSSAIPTGSIILGFGSGPFSAGAFSAGFFGGQGFGSDIALTPTQYARQTPEIQALFTLVYRLAGSNGLVDTYLPIFQGVEAPPLPPIFTESPLLDPNSPTTELVSAYRNAKTVGQFFAPSITGSQYAAMSVGYQGEYVPDFVNDGNYTLDPAAFYDLIVLDLNGNPTGEVTRSGILAPQRQTAWEITDDSLSIYELD